MTTADPGRPDGSGQPSGPGHPNDPGRPDGSGQPGAVTSYTSDLPFNVLRWVSVAALVALAYMGAMDALSNNWFAVATSVLLILLVAFAIARPAFALARSAVTADSRGVRRRGGWDFRWRELASAEVRIHKDIQYLVVVPAAEPRGMDLTRFFVRGSDFPPTSFVAPLDTHKAPEFKDAIARYLWA